MANLSDSQADAITRLRDLLLANEPEQLAIASIVEPERFALAAVALAARHGLALESADLLSRLQPDILGLDRFGAAQLMLDQAPPRHWLPTAIIGGPAGILVEWLHFAAAPLDLPFFEDSLRSARALPFNRLMRCTTPLSALAAFDDMPPPDGLVFHMSRCGSTLVSQMLASLPHSIAISEAPPLDAVIQLAARGQVPPAVVRQMVAALTRDRDGAARYRFVKLDSWHSLALPMLRRLFPDTPWVFLHRDPVEVMVSQQGMPGFHAVPGMIPLDAFGIDCPGGIGDDDYLGWMLGRICDAAADGLALGGGIAVNYRDLPHAVEQRILPHFGIALDVQAREALVAAGSRNAKRPDTRFTADAATKQQAASPQLRAIAARHIAPACARLEERR